MEHFLDYLFRPDAELGKVDMSIDVGLRVTQNVTDLKWCEG